MYHSFAYKNINTIQELLEDVNYDYKLGMEFEEGFMDKIKKDKEEALDANDPDLHGDAEYVLSQRSGKKPETEQKVEATINN